MINIYWAWPGTGLATWLTQDRRCPPIVYDKGGHRRSKRGLKSNKKSPSGLRILNSLSSWSHLLSCIATSHVTITVTSLLQSVSHRSRIITQKFDFAAIQREKQTMLD